jgi:hypothetical protein
MKSQKASRLDDKISPSEPRLFLPRTSLNKGRWIPVIRPEISPLQRGLQSN